MPLPARCQCECLGRRRPRRFASAGARRYDDGAVVCEQLAVSRQCGAGGADGRNRYEVAECRCPRAASANAWAVGDLAALRAQALADTTTAQLYANSWPYLDNAELVALTVETDTKWLNAAARALPVRMPGPSATSPLCERRRSPIRRRRSCMRTAGRISTMRSWWR